MQQIILNDNTLDTHLKEYSKDKYAYSNTVIEVYSSPDLKKSLTITNKSYILTTLINSLDRNTFKTLIPHIDLPELVKTCELLDAKRAKKQLVKRIEKGGKKTRINEAKNKLGVIKSHGYLNLSLTSSKIKLITSWVLSQSEEQLINKALMIDKQSWKTLADLCHINSEKLSVKWFLPWCFGNPAPEESIIHKLENASSDLKFLSLCEDYKLPYEYVRYASKQRNVPASLMDNYNLSVAKNENLRTVLWWWKELQSNDVNTHIEERLKQVEIVDVPYGVLADLLMNVNHPGLRRELVRVAQNRMNEYKLNIDSPVVVLCDASASNQNIKYYHFFDLFSNSSRITSIPRT